MKTKIKLSEIRELVREIIKEEMDAYQPAPDDEKDTEEEKPPHPALVEVSDVDKKRIEQIKKDIEYNRELIRTHKGGEYFSANDYHKRIEKLQNDLTAIHARSKISKPNKPTTEGLVEKHLGFKKLVKQLVKKGIPKEHEVILREMTDEEIDEGAEALAAWIGRKKYGKKAFQAKATAGKRKDEAVFTTTKKQCNICKKPIDTTWKPGHLENPNYCQGHSTEERTAYEKAAAGKRKASK